MGEKMKCMKIIKRMPERVIPLIITISGIVIIDYFYPDSSFIPDWLFGIYVILLVLSFLFNIKLFMAIVDQIDLDEEEETLLDDPNYWQKFSFNECFEKYRADRYLRKVALKQMVKKGGSFNDWWKAYKQAKIDFENNRCEEVWGHALYEEVPEFFICNYTSDEFADFERVALKEMKKLGTVEDWKSVLKEPIIDDYLEQFARKQIEILEILEKRKNKK
jgi:hypothetical protein